MNYMYNGLNFAKSENINILLILKLSKDLKAIIHICLKPVGKLTSE